jgi:CubicO group peptidase (beta-lactamase class C family)/rhamnogalacturonyl hydrolase YesR
MNTGREAMQSFEVVKNPTASPSRRGVPARVRMIVSSIAVCALAANVGNVTPCQTKAVSGSSYDNTKTLAKVVEPYIDNREIAGAVALIANRDRVLAREVIGYANLAEHSPMRVNKMFWIASMSKAMTAAAVMMLVDEGKISLDDPVENYLPEFKTQKVSTHPDTTGPSSRSDSLAPASDENAAGKLAPLDHPVTIRELLSHTAGLPFSSKRETPALDLLPLKTAVESYSAEPLESQPGAKYSYSNEGFNTAGRIVEVVSGMPFEEFLQQRLFTPLGMTDTTFWPNNEQLRRLAQPYESGTLRPMPIDQLTYPLDDRRRRFPIPAGGLFSTADDVSRFCQMMLNGGTFQGKRYLSEKSVRLITTKETGDAVEKPYGFGWNIGPGFYEHSGAYKTDMKVDVKRGWIVVLMVQHSNDWKPEERERLMDALEETMIHPEGNASSVQPMRVFSPNGIATASNITAEEQTGIDEDVARHLGDVSADPGPKANLSRSIDPAAVHAAMQKVADWELKRAEPYLTQNWAWAVLDTGFMAASRELNDPRYTNAMQAMAERFHWELGQEDLAGRGSPDSNDQALAQTYLELYSRDPSPERIGPARHGFDSWLAGQKPPLPEDQFQILWWWCDTLFMSPPAWAEMAKATQDRKYLDYLDKRWWETSNALYDPRYHLFYRDKSFIGQKDAAGKPIFWSRGNGWVIGGLARTLEYMPKNYPDRSRFEDRMRVMAAEFASIQDPESGLWHSDLLDSSDFPQPEVSGSALITLGLAWGVNHAVLDRASYTQVIERAWRGMVNEIYMDGRLGNIQQTGGAPNYFLPGSSYNFGVGAFLLAGEQVAHLGTQLAKEDSGRLRITKSEERTERSH